MRIVTALLLALSLAACYKPIIHQGNIIREDKLSQISQGDSRFRVETLLGSPAVVDRLHPRTVYYIEQLEDHENNRAFIRRVTIVYDRALRVQRIHKAGFDSKKEG